MTPRQSSPISDSHDSNVRKRVCKACDRCRLKKSKCDGATPCSRCRADNAICVFGERKKAHDKVYPKGYVEMLEQQQQWLVYGLQEMYRRSCEGEGWPGDPLKCESNGHPLTHDLLTRLGALDHSKGEFFEENTEALQQECLRQSGCMQRQESSDGSSESAQSPVMASRFSDAFARHMPPTPPKVSPVSRTQAPAVKTEPQISPSNPTFNTTMPMQGVVNPLALQTPQQWTNSGFNSFDDMDYVNTADYSNFLDDPMFSRQMPINCMMPSSYMDSKNDYDDFNQFFNANAPEIAST